MDFQRVAQALSDVRDTQGTLTKEALLREYGVQVEGFKDVLKYIYDPSFTTGLKAQKLYKLSFQLPSSKEYTVEQIMEFLRENNTGTEYAAAHALDFVLGIEEETDATWQWAAEGLVTKNLQIGVSVTTLNKVYGRGFIPVIGIMRGMQAPAGFSGIYLATEKIDGNRRIIMNKKSGVEIYTRSGKRDMGLVEIEHEVAATLPKGYVFDTECIAVGKFTDSIALRQASASILNRRNQERTGVQALCFDCMCQTEYDSGISKFSALGRKALAAAMFNDESSYEKLYALGKDLDSIKNGTRFADTVETLWKIFKNTREHNSVGVLPILGVVHNMSEALNIAQPIWETGGEGLMLVDWQSPYEVNPNPRKSLLKIKQTTEYALEVLDVYEGTGKYVGMLGGILLNYEGFTVGCGSGFTDWDRQYYWAHPKKLIGRVVEIDSFGESINQNGERSLNCPIFKRIKR